MQQELSWNRLYEHDHTTFYEVATNHALCETAFNSETKWSNICNIEVDREYRRQGIGSFVVASARTHAESLNAEVVLAGIISRESLDVMTKVFGRDAVHIDRKGNYDTPNSTAAALWLEL